MNRLALAFSAFLLVSFSSHATENSCPPPAAPACSVEGKDISQDQAAILAAISEQTFCFQAVKLAEACGTGQGSDVRYVNAATVKCEGRLASLSPSQTDLNNLSNLKAACQRKWFGREGTQYISINAFCKLRALAWTLNLLDENE
jgi:hypothetical protein